MITVNIWRLIAWARLVHFTRKIRKKIEKQFAENVQWRKTHASPPPLPNQPYRNHENSIKVLTS